MKTYLLLQLILLPVLSFGQEWAPIGAKWTYDHDPGLPPYLTTIESVKDTVMLTRTCKILISKQINAVMKPNGSYYYDTLTVSKDFIYDSNDTVYHYNKYDNLFYPLYLLNVKAHDTILVREKIVPCTKNEYFCSRFEYIADSISSITLQNHTLKAIYNSETTASEWTFNRTWNYEKYPIVEKLGSLKYLFGVSEKIVMEGGIRCLRCYFDYKISYKANYWNKDCDYLEPLPGPSVSVKEISFEEIVVFPNPFDSHLTINLEGSKTPFEFELHDSSGRLIIKGNTTKIYTGKLPEGIYFLRLILNQGETKTVKLIKRKL